MIIFKGIKKINHPVCFLVFSNGEKEITIPVLKKVGELIQHHLQVISKENLVIERCNEEESD